MAKIQNKSAPNSKRRENLSWLRNQNVGEISATFPSADFGVLRKIRLDIDMKNIKDKSAPNSKRRENLSPLPTPKSKRREDFSSKNNSTKTWRILRSLPRISNLARKSLAVAAARHFLRRNSGWQPNVQKFTLRRLDDLLFRLYNVLFSFFKIQWALGTARLSPSGRLRTAGCVGGVGTVRPRWGSGSLGAR